jgi:hypothetical protein
MKPDAVWRGADLPVDDTDVALFSAATRVTVHSGKTAKFWTSSWIDGMSLPSMFPRLFEHCKKENRTVAEAMHNNTWISDLMHDVTTPIFGDYVMLWIMVEAAGFNPLDAADDQIIWTRAADGCYSAKSAYLLQFEGVESLGVIPLQVLHVVVAAKENLDSRSFARPGVDQSILMSALLP